MSALQQFWLRRGRFREALAGFDAVLADHHPESMASDVWVRAVADHGTVAGWIAVPASLDRAQDALAIARQLDDPALIIRALNACGMLAFYDAELTQRYFGEAVDMVRASDSPSSLGPILTYLAAAGVIAGEPVAARAAAEEARDLGNALGDPFISVAGRIWLCVTLWLQGDLIKTAESLQGLAEDAEAAGNPSMATLARVACGFTLAHQGQPAAAQGAAENGQQVAEAIGGVYRDGVYATLALAALAAGDAAAARRAAEEAWQHTIPERMLFTGSFNPTAEAVLACGDLAAARRWADRTVAMVSGCHQVAALTMRALVAMAQDEPEQAERDAHDALTVAVRTGDLSACPTPWNAWPAWRPTVATTHTRRVCGRSGGDAAAHGGLFAFRCTKPTTTRGHKVRDALGQDNFDAAWAEGGALSTEEAIAYAQRGRGERKRPTTGWGSLTPMENDVVALVREGLGNKDIGARLFISPRTVQTHLTHVYAKLGLTSRVQLVQLSLGRGQNA